MEGLRRIEEHTREELLVSADYDATLRRAAVNARVPFWERTVAKAPSRCASISALSCCASSTLATSSRASGSQGSSSVTR